jgi:hypothetical protein
MDVNKIFGLFDSGSEGKVEKEAFVDFTESPVYYLGMFKKLILNNDIFKTKVKFFLEQFYPEIDNEESEEQGENITYERAWEYVKKFNINEESHRESITLILDKDLLKALDKAIFHFQEIEYYERCAYLKKISDEVKKLLST